MFACKKSYFIAFSILIAFSFFTTTAAKAQTAAEYQVKAVFIYNFTRFIDWPAAAFESAGSPFTIGILGEDPFGNALEEAVGSEKVNNHSIVIKRFATVKEVTACQILFINSKDAEYIKNTISELKDKSVLTVSDASNFASSGGVIGFFLENNKVRMQINTEAAKAASLVISSKLLSLSKVL